MALNLRAPTGEVPWPIIVLEGGEKSGKTYESILASADPRIQHCWAMDLGEGSLDEYRDIPGADFQIINHDGTWRQIMAELEEAVTESEAVAAKGECPLLVIDTGTAEWEMLKSWVDVRARRQKTNIAKLRADPDAEIKASRNLWNDAEDRHKAFMSCLRRFQGIVVLTARGKVISATDASGQPAKDGSKDYRVEGHKNMAFDANAWIRLSRDEPPLVVGLRHWKYGIRPGRDRQQSVPDFSIPWLVFDLMGCKAGVTKGRKQVELNADQFLDHEQPDPDEDDDARSPAVGRGDAPRRRNRVMTPDGHGRMVDTPPAQDRPEPQAPPRDAVAAADQPRKLHPDQERDERARKAKTGVDMVLTAANIDVAANNVNLARRSVAANVQVYGLMSPAERDTLGLDVDRDGRITLANLAMRVSNYVREHNRSVRDPLDSGSVSPEAARQAVARTPEEVAEELLTKTGVRVEPGRVDEEPPPADEEPTYRFDQQGATG